MDWDRKTKVKAQGLKAALTSFQTLAVFIIAKNVLDEGKTLAAKLQKCDQDIYDAYMMIDEVINGVKTLRNTIDTTFHFWYDEILQLAETMGVMESVPRKTSLQRNRSNIPSPSPKEHYKLTVAIPLLDSFINQFEKRFAGEERFGHILLCLIPSVLLNKTSSVQPSEHLDKLLYWEQDLPCSKSLGNELRRWQTLWQQKEQENSNIPNNLPLALGSCDAEMSINFW